MTVTQGIKRLGMPAVAALGMLFVALTATSWLIDRDAVRKSVEAQIRAATGLDLVVSGKTVISVFPGSYVTLHQVSLKDGSGGTSALIVDALTANLSLLPILTQRFEISDLSLLNPHINVTRNAAGENNWTPIIDALARTMKPSNGAPAPFSEIRIMQGSIVFHDEARQNSESLDNIDVSLAWPAISRSFAATGQFDWRGERVEGSFSIADLGAAISGERSGIKARIASAPLKLAFDGTLANRTSLLLEGTLAADTPSLRSALRWSGHAPIGSTGLGRFALKARTNLVGESIALTNVNLELDGNTAEGVLTYNKTTGRQTLQGTLAANVLDLTPYIGTARLLANGAHDWNRQAFDLRGLSATDLDIRLSAAKVTIGPSKLGRTALGANLRNGALALSIGEAQIYGGLVKGSLAIARTDTTADVKAQFRFIDVDLEAGASELFGIRKLSGRGDLGVSLEASGSSAFALAQSLDGTATLIGHDGAIAGFNVEQLLRRLERRPLSGVSNFRSGTTPFDKLKIAISINDGMAKADEIEIDGPAARVTLSGTTSIPSREYDLKGIASLVSAPDAEPGFQLPFVVQGPWDDPLIFPDSDILIRRSPATAPLLDSLKDRKTRDAVKAVIDRLTGRKQPAAPANVEPPAAAPSADLPPPAASSPAQSSSAN